jgi:hypothetical protein
VLITASRSTAQNGKATLTVTFPDGRIHRSTGGAAARAQAVVLVAHTPDDTIGVWGVRGDLNKAQEEAHRLATATTRRERAPIRGMKATYRPVTPKHIAIAVPVTDA